MYSDEVSKDLMALSMTIEKSKKIINRANTTTRKLTIYKSDYSINSSDTNNDNSSYFSNANNLAKSDSKQNYYCSLENYENTLFGSSNLSTPSAVIVSSNHIGPNTGSISYLSDIEQAILRSTNPIQISETEDIVINGQKGILLNKDEIKKWKGDLPLKNYSVNMDENPDIITKRSEHKIEYIQELAIRYLKPPTPPSAGEIIINQEANQIHPPAPPLIIRQQPPRPSTPEPLIIREAPPQPPPQVGRKVITISGKKLPPPPRKVIIERLAPLPSKPQSVIIERWLPYNQAKRRVIFNRNNQKDAVILKPKNVIVQWETPEVEVKKEYKYLGIIRANPVDYVQRYGDSLIYSNDLPNFIKEIKTPDGLTLAADSENHIYELEGDVEALSLIDLDKEGLGHYKSYLSNFSSINAHSSTSTSFAKQNNNYIMFGEVGSSSSNSASTISPFSSNIQLNILIESLFKQVDMNETGHISISEAENLLIRLNDRIGKKYGEHDVIAFFKNSDQKNKGFLNLEEFRRAFLQLSS
jgi:Ca2+-binding EF-hand superfamily protein